jgi:hypothetical protein
MTISYADIAMSLSDDSGVVIYDHNVFIIQATGSFNAIFAFRVEFEI